MEWCTSRTFARIPGRRSGVGARQETDSSGLVCFPITMALTTKFRADALPLSYTVNSWTLGARSEERRVGKECRSRCDWSSDVCSSDLLIWARLLSDHDGPYNEIQSGRFATQLYREFMDPRRVEDWTEYWYPVRGLGGGFVEATKQLALNVLFSSTQNGTAQAEVKLVVSPVVELHDTRVRVFLDAKLLRELAVATFEPLQPVAFTLPVESVDEAKKELKIQILSADGRELLSWSAAAPIDGNPDFVPAAGIAPRRFTYSPKTPVEEVYLHGVWLEKRGNPEAAQEFYQRALERDSGFIPALLKEAWKSYQAADFNRAEALTARALERDSSDPRVHYAAGMIYRAAGRLTLAQDAFWASIH